MTNSKGRFENQTKVFCILSDDRVFKAKSPDMFSLLFQRVGLNAVYVPFEIEPDCIGSALTSLRALNIAGANVGVPYKETVIPHLDELSEGANFIGAINTIVRRGTVLKGYNTNAIGFMDTLNQVDFDTAGKSVLVFGSGGAAKAVVFVFNWLRAENIYVVGRNQAAVAHIVESIGGTGSLLEDLDGTRMPVDIVVNATSVSSPQESAELSELISRLDLPGCQLIIDLNYGREENFWQERAASTGIRFIDGLLPLAFQARRSFALWTGLQVEAREFLDALKELPASRHVIW
ncbi:MAG: shikimate dehydrogenase [Desulfobacterales bacterium]|jgi:shikimate dehydrogenase